MRVSLSIFLTVILAVTLLGCTAVTETEPTDLHKAVNPPMKMTVGNNEWTVTLADNSSAEALLGLLQDGPLTIAMRDYANMEKVGPIGRDLPRNDEQITTAPGDLILYQGNALVIYYAPNTWNFTRLGKIDNVTQEELINILGDRDVKVTLSLMNEKENAQ